MLSVLTVDSYIGDYTTLLQTPAPGSHAHTRRTGTGITLNQKLPLNNLPWNPEGVAMCGLAVQTPAICDACFGGSVVLTRSRCLVCNRRLGLQRAVGSAPRRGFRCSLRCCTLAVVDLHSPFDGVGRIFGVAPWLTATLTPFGADLAATRVTTAPLIYPITDLHWPPIRSPMVYPICLPPLSCTICGLHIPQFV